MESVTWFCSTTPKPCLDQKLTGLRLNGTTGSFPGTTLKLARTCMAGTMHICRSSYKPSSFCFDKPIPEEIIEKPVALSEKSIGENPRCSNCEAKGAIPCATCSSSGLYIDSIMESQGIIVKVRCLGCGGSGNIMCMQCGGRGHL